MRFTKNFNPISDPKMACSCCHQGYLSIAILIVLEDIRQHFGQPVTITSGPRCKEYNLSVGGAKNSEHITTKDDPEVDAVDIKVKDVSPTKVTVFLKERPYANLLGIGKYSNWVHVDTRGYPARW